MFFSIPMGAQQAKPAPKPKARPQSQFVAPVGHQTQGAALARSQREAYELDAADGVVDGKFYGAEVRVTPKDVPPYTAPAAAAYHSMPGNAHMTVPLHYNDARPVYAEPQNDYHGPGLSRGQPSVTRYGGSRVYHREYQNEGPPQPEYSVNRQQSGGYPMDTYTQPAYWGEAPPVPAPPPAHNEYAQPAWTSYQYTCDSYARPAAAPGFGPASYSAPPPPQLPPQVSQVVNHLPPPTSLMPSSASIVPSHQPKSYYDTYSRFAKVEFHTVAQSPYQNLLENQSRNIGQLLTHDGTIGLTGDTTDQWVESLAQAPRHEPAFVPAAQAPPRPFAFEAAPGASRFETFKANAAAARAAAQPQLQVYSPPPAPPAWDQTDNTTLGGFDADTSARMAFRRYDVDGNGFLDIYEFMAAMKALGMGSTFKEAQDNFGEIDNDGGGAIEEDEFVGWYTRNFERIREGQDPKKLAQAIFRRYDQDGNGTLDATEFVGAMRDLGLGYTVEDAQFVFDTFDNDGGGTIDEEEFVNQYYEQWLQSQ